jgi:hypothetical protein
LFFGTVTALIGLWWCYRVRLAAELLVFATTAIVLFAISQPVGLRPRFLMLTFPLVIGAASLPTRWYRIVGIASSVVMLLFLYEELTSFAVFP